MISLMSNNSKKKFNLPVSATEAHRRITWRQRPSPKKTRKTNYNWKHLFVEILPYPKIKKANYFDLVLIIKTTNGKERKNELDHQKNNNSNKLTNKTSGSLLNNFHTKWSGHMWFITITFDGNVFGCIETFIGTAAVHTFCIGLCWALIASNGQY